MPRLSTTYVNTISNSVVNTYQLHPILACLWKQIDISHKSSPQNKPTVIPLPWLKQCIMSPVKPLQCRSVTTHLFSQHSLASLSDCSPSCQNPALLQQQRCRAAALHLAGYTPSQGVLLFSVPST